MVNIQSEVVTHLEMMGKLIAHVDMSTLKIRKFKFGTDLDTFRVSIVVILTIVVTESNQQLNPR